MEEIELVMAIRRKMAQTQMRSFMGNICDSIQPLCVPFSPVSNFDFSEGCSNLCHAGY